MKYTTTRLLALFSLLFLTALTTTASAQCDDDTIPPVAICDAEVTILTVPGVGATLFAEEVDEGSYDDCTAVDLEIVLSDDDTGTPPGTVSLDFPDVDADYSVVLYVTDQAGNYSNCFMAVHVVSPDPGCIDDTEAPVVECESVLSVSVNPATGSAIIFVNTFLDAFSDNCDIDLDLSVNFLENSTGEAQGASTITFSEVGTTQVEVWAVDDFGNASNCQTEVVVENIFNCSPDLTAPTVVCLAGLEVQAHPTDGVDIWALDIDAGSFDLCSDVSLRIEEGTEPSDEIPTTEVVTLPSEIGEYLLIVWAQDESGNTSQCLTFVSITGFYYAVEGQIFQDANDNCTLDTDEVDSGLEGWTIRATNLATGDISSTQTESDGSYSLPAYGDATANDFTIEVVLPNGLGTGCATSLTLNDANTVTSGINFPVELISGCDYLTVDVSAPFLRRCFENNYFVNYTNYSSYAIDDATVSLQLDPFMEVVSTSVAYTDLGGGLIEFDLGTVPAGTGGQVVVSILLSCETELGATHCVEATIIPFTCIPATGFAELTVEGDCDPTNGEVNFTITNVGDNPMTSPRSHIIIEDVVMYMTGEEPVDLGSGETIGFSFPANGATWRLAINQDESFPFGGTAAAFVEGCGGFTPGMATQFALTSSKPNVAQDCQENIGSWDPNDKQAFPRGYGEENYLEANTTINYLIRFQNTGTDTAFNIRIDDQLSEHLDWTTLVPGASSHPYRMELKEDGLLSFHFDNIMLPDSNVNLVESNGFVKFEIEQVRDNAIGTLIDNTASIYFDFNEAVVTNTMRHTIGEDFVLVNTQNVLVPGLRLTVAPNPLQTSSILRLEGMDLKEGHCQVYDVQGKLVCEAPFNGQSLELQREQLGSAGLYFYQILDGQQPLVQGKLLVE